MLASTHLTECAARWMRGGGCRAAKRKRPRQIAGGDRDQRLLDDQRGNHAGGLVAGFSAINLKLTRLVGRKADRGGLTGGDRGSLDVKLVDQEVVRDRAFVLKDDLDGLAPLDGERARIVSKLRADDLDPLSRARRGRGRR